MEVTITSGVSSVTFELSNRDALLTLKCPDDAMERIYKPALLQIIAQELPGVYRQYFTGMEQ